MDSRFEWNWKQEVLSKIAEYENWFKKSRAVNYRRDESVDITAVVSKYLKIGVMVHADWNLGGSFRGYAVLTSLRKIRERKTPYSFTYLLVKNLKSDPLEIDFLENEIESVVRQLEGEDDDLRSLGYSKNRPELFYPYSRFYEENGHLFRMSVEMRTQRASEGSQGRLEEYLQVSLYRIRDKEEKDSLIGSIECHNHQTRNRADAIVRAESMLPDWLFPYVKISDLGIDRLTHLRTLPEGLKYRIIRGY